MAKAYVFLANGFEDIEALTPVDVLRRGGVEVVTVAIEDDMPVVTSAHGVPVMADALAADCQYGDADLIVLPGGMPGAQNLYESAIVREAVKQQIGAGKRVAAICAAPAVVLGSRASGPPAIRASSICSRGPSTRATCAPSTDSSPRPRDRPQPSPSPTSCWLS